MLQVLNGKERNQAFLQFLLFFGITTALIVGAIFFNFRFPETERNYLRDEVSRLRGERDKQRSFVSLMEETRYLLDSARKGGVSSVQTNAILGAKLAELNQAKNVTDTAVLKKLNSTIIDAFNSLQMVNTQLKEQDSKDRQIEKLKADLQVCETRLDTYQTEYRKLNTTP